MGRLLHSDVAAAWALIVAVGIALVWANGPWSGSYYATWLHPTSGGGSTFQDFATVRDWVNGGLMAGFFLVVGLEIGRERRHGDLADAEFRRDEVERRRQALAEHQFDAVTLQGARNQMRAAGHRHFVA